MKAAMDSCAIISSVPTVSTRSDDLALAAHLPFDVWLAISQYLSIKDIEAIRASSRILRALMAERSVWHAALHDVLSVKPLPYLRAAVSRMSCAELRTTCVRVATLEHAFARGELAPRAVGPPVQSDYVQVCLLPGGERYVAATARGSLEVHDVSGKHGAERPRTAVPERPPMRTDVRMLPRSPHEVVISQVLHWNNDPSYDGTTDIEFRLYRLEEQCVFTLLRVYRPEVARNIVHHGVYASGDGFALLYLRGRYERDYVVEIHFVSEGGIDQDRSICARLCGWIMCSYMQDFLPLFGCVSLLSLNRLLLAASEGVYLYDVSPPSLACEPKGIMDLRPIWTTYSRWLTRTPIMSPPVISTPDGPEPRARCMLWTGKDVLDFDIPLGPVTDDSRFMLHVVHTQYNHAPIHLGHGVGVQLLQSQPQKRIPTPAFSMAFGWGCEDGHVRLGREGPGVRKARLEREWVVRDGDGVGSVDDLSVDELSGRMSVLDRSTGNLQIYDMV